MKKTVLIVILVAFAFVLGAALTSRSYTGKSPARQSIDRMMPAEFKQARESGGIKLLDIRTADEYSAGHLSGATQIDYYQTQAFSDYLDKLDKNAKYLIYCRSGNRTGEALMLMKDKGFTHVSDLAGGYNAWVSAGYEVEK